jgi:hypothetical protein
MSLSRIRNTFLEVFLVISVSAVSQEKTRLTGQIITAEPLNSPIHLINITREKGGVSELSGHFSVEVNIGDSLVFSSVQYKKKSIVIDRKKHYALIPFYKCH